jgi:hypothetical protein
MVRSAIVAAMLLACGSSTTGPVSPPNNVAAEPELRCKTAVERASAAIKLRAKDVTMAIGECEQQEWPRPLRECVAAAHDDPALVACGTKYNLGTHGIFADNNATRRAMKAMEHFRDEMCACKDTACAQHVSDEMSKWAADAAKQNDESWRMTDEETKRATEIGETMGKCMQQAMSAPP